MKKISNLIILGNFLVAVLVFTTSCEKPQLAEKAKPIEPIVLEALPEEPEPSPVQFPLATTIRNQSGKELTGQILAKSGDEIAFQRDADGNQFVIPLANLHVDDQVRYAEVDDQEAGLVALIKETKLLTVTQTRVTRPTGQRRRLSLDYENAPSYEQAVKRAKENGTDILLVFMSTPEVSEDCSS